MSFLDVFNRPVGRLVKEPYIPYSDIEGENGKHMMRLHWSGLVDIFTRVMIEHLH